MTNVIKNFNIYSGEYKIRDILLWAEGITLEIGMVIDIEDASAEHSDPTLALAILSGEDLEFIDEKDADTFFTNRLCLATCQIKHLSYNTSFAPIQINEDNRLDLVEALENNKQKLINIIEDNRRKVTELNLKHIRQRPLS